MKTRTPSRRLAPAIAAAWLAVAGPVLAQQFMIGDVNGSYDITAADVFYLANYLKAGGAEPLGSGDLNGDGLIDDRDLELLSISAIGGTEIASELVDEAGATFEKGAFKVVIPPGLFSGKSLVTIKEGPNPYTSLTTSNLFTITGLPSYASADLQVSLPLERAGKATAAFTTSTRAYDPLQPRINDSGPYVGFVDTGLHYPTGAARVMGFIVDAKNWVGSKGAAATAAISSAVSSAETAVANQLGLYSLVYDKSIKTYNNNFEIFMTQLQWDTSSFYDTAKDIGWFMEALRPAYAKDFGLSWSVITPATRIIFEDLGGDRGQMIGSKLAQYADYLIVDKTVMPSGLNTELKATLAHEYFHMLQGQYDPRWIGLRRTIGDSVSKTNYYLWWHEAAATAMEPRYSGSPDTPDVAWENWSAPYEGMVLDAGSQTLLQRHGYGMSGLPKALMDDYGTAIMGTIYRRMRDHWLFNNGEYPFESIANAANPADPNNIGWWRTYIRKNTVGEIFPEVPVLLAAGISGKPESTLIPALSPPSYPWPLAKFFEAKDLSATPYFINLDGVSFSAGQALTLAVPFPKPFEWWFRGEAGLMVFKVSNDKKKIEYLDGDGQQAILTIPNPAALQPEGASLLLLVLNNRHKAPYSEKSNIMLYSLTGKPSSYTHYCTHATATFTWSGFKNVFPYLLGDGNNMNMRADYPDVGNSVSASVQVAPKDCKLGESYYWSFSLFGKRETRPVTCGVTEDLYFDGVFQGKTSMNELESMSFSYAVRSQDSEGRIEVTSDCQLHVTPFLLDVPAS